jgi:hypothetical protein
MILLESLIDKILPAASCVWSRFSLWSGGKGDWCVGLTNLTPSCADRLEIWEPQTPGNHKVYPGLQREYFYLYVIHEDNYRLLWELYGVELYRVEYCTLCKMLCFRMLIVLVDIITTVFITWTCVRFQRAVDVSRLSCHSSACID